jgi:hypothetical protein
MGNAEAGGFGSPVSTKRRVWVHTQFCFPPKPTRHLTRDGHLFQVGHYLLITRKNRNGASFGITARSWLPVAIIPWP